MGAHGGARPVRWRAPALTVTVVVSVVLVLQTHWIRHRGAPHPTAPPTPQLRHIRSSAVGQPTPSPASPSSRTRSPADVAAATLHRLVRQHSRGSVSVAAFDVGSGSQVTVGARRGMLTASLVKLEFLETLLLRHDRSGTALSGDERAETREMIDNSDNGAADAIYWDDGAGTGLVAAERPLGLSAQRTKPRGDDFWGLSTSSAPEQIALLKDLVLPSSPLSRANRKYAVQLMEHVEADQRWGVPAAADKGSTYAVKNGWLAIDDDGGRWAVSSDGIVQVNGKRVLISVMTQHEESMQDGVSLVQRLARAAAAVVVAAR